MTEQIPIASRERVAEVVREALSFEPGHAHGPLLTQQANRVAHRLFELGAFRDEATVKAEALEAEAEAAIGTVRGPFGLPFAAVAVGHLRAHAAALRAGEGV